MCISILQLYGDNFDGFHVMSGKYQFLDKTVNNKELNNSCNEKYAVCA